MNRLDSRAVRGKQDEKETSRKKNQSIFIRSPAQLWCLIYTYNFQKKPV